MDSWLQDLDGLIDSKNIPGLVSATPVEALRKQYDLDALCGLRPFDHQVIGIDKVVTHPYFALFDEMGAGKTLQTVVAACLLFLRGAIHRVVVIAPAAVRAVWFDQEFGEIEKHIFANLSARVTLFHSKTKTWDRTPEAPVARSEWVITNYELLRSKQWLVKLLPYIDAKTLLVLDESSAVKSYKAKQTKAIMEIRKRAGRVVMLNGTPVPNNPLDLFSQGNILHPSILECGFITHFRARYCEMGGFEVKLWNGKKVPTQVVGWKNLPDLTKRFAPYVLRRLKTDCLDLPPKLDPVPIPVPLEETTWKHYKAMRDDMVTWLSDSEVSMSHQAMTKAMRLAQLTSGFIGGVEALDEEPETEGEPVFLPPDLLLEKSGQELFDFLYTKTSKAVSPIIRISQEKLDAMMDWVDVLLESDPNLKLLVFANFKPEVVHATAEFRNRFKAMEVGNLRGGQPKEEERDAVKLLDPRYAPKGPATLFATSKGAMGFTFTAAHTVARLSRNYSLWQWLQSDDRVHRPGQTSPVSYTDFIATGPKGQKTVDTGIFNALLGKLDLATATTAAWRAIIAA